MSTTIEISKLKKQIYVRDGLNEDHWLMLAGLIDGGVQLPPILITEDGAIIDGRHRVRAHEFLGLTTIEAIVVKESRTVELVGLAIKENIGGSLPINKKDLQHCMEIMLEKHLTQKQIFGELKQYLPVGLLKTAMQTAGWMVRTRKIRRALDLMAETPTLSVGDAARLVGVAEDTLQNAISKKKPVAVNVISTTKANLKRRFTNFNRSLGQDVKYMVLTWTEGDLSTENVDELMQFYNQQVNNVLMNCQDTLKRWVAKRQTQ